MNYSAIEKLCAIANYCDEAVSALEDAGAEPLVLQTWLRGTGPLAKDLQALAVSPAAQSQPTGRFSGVRAPGAPAPVKTTSAVQAAPKSAPATKPEAKAVKKTGTVSIPASKTVTLKPPGKPKMAGT